MGGQVLGRDIQVGELDVVNHHTFKPVLAVPVEILPVHHTAARAQLLTVIAVAQGVVDDGAKGARIHEVAHVIVIVEPLDIVQIEGQRAVDELVDRTGRQILACNRDRVARVQVAQGTRSGVGDLDEDGR